MKRSKGVSRLKKRAKKTAPLAPVDAAPLLRHGSSEIFPIVGIGASAGGLEAFMQLLKALAERPGMAFVLVPHLDPTHESAMTELLSRASQMPVREVSDAMQTAPNTVYVIPP